MAKIMALFPPAQSPRPAQQLRPANAGLSDDNDNYYDGRGDWNPTLRRDLVFARYSYSNRNRFIPGFFGGIADGTSTSAWGRQKTAGVTVAFIGWTRSLTPALTNEFRAGFRNANVSQAQQDPLRPEPHRPIRPPGVPEKSGRQRRASRKPRLRTSPSSGPRTSSQNPKPRKQFQWIDFPRLDPRARIP